LKSNGCIAGPPILESDHKGEILIAILGSLGSAQFASHKLLSSGLSSAIGRRIEIVVELDGLRIMNNYVGHSIERLYTSLNSKSKRVVMDVLEYVKVESPAAPASTPHEHSKSYRAASIVV
jgi:hypothetical protein